MKKLRYLALFLIALSCSGCDSSDYIWVPKGYNVKDCNWCGDPARSPQNCFPDYEDYVKFYIFRFRTEPQGATIISTEPRKRELCTTPCDYTFVGSPTDFITFVEISKSGYVSQEIPLTPEFHENTHGNIIIRMENKELVFNLVYTPPNAIVYRHTGEKDIIICDHSPCSYIYNPDNGIEFLVLSADGYEPHSIRISEEDYYKSTVRVDLEPVKKQKSK